MILCSTVVADKNSMLKLVHIANGAALDFIPIVVIIGGMPPFSHYLW